MRIDGIDSPTERLDSGINPAMLTKVVSTLPGGFAVCIAQFVGAGLWCIGHMAPAPCPQVHSDPCGSAALIHSATGTSATVPTWQHSQIAVSGASTRRRHDIRRTLYRPAAEPVKHDRAPVPFVCRIGDFATRSAQLCPFLPHS
jgi:hypothetical protein